MLTKKDYEAIAKIIKDATTDEYNEYNGTSFKGLNRDKVIDELIDYCQQENPRFQGLKFREACQ